jgi:hypothetical protein
MKILVFLHGTTIMHQSAIGCTREERVKQVMDKDEGIWDFESYIPVGDTVAKLQGWQAQGAGIIYMSSHMNIEDVQRDDFVLRKYAFPGGDIIFRSSGETYGDVILRVMPDIIIEDDCESIGGEVEQVYAQIPPPLKDRIKSILVKEFGGIDHLPEDLIALDDY